MLQLVELLHRFDFLIANTTKNSAISEVTPYGLA